MNELNKTVSYTIPSFYNHYLSNIEADTVYDIDYPTYRKIVTEYFCYLRDQLLEESKEVKLPYRMGSIQIVKKQPKHLDGRSLRIDYNLLIYLTNTQDSISTDFTGINRICQCLTKVSIRLYLLEQIKDIQHK